uniref:Moubatin-like 6 n=1 Tax=Ornithodoros parkeri TaxID=140564 RepID=A6N9P7_ORNPR|nr:moubatin-like 6 [Ornithodoros parkeri]
MLRTLQVLFLSICLLGGVAVAEEQCASTVTEAWDAITQPPNGHYLLQQSTQEDPKDCLKGEVPTGQNKPKANVKMTYKDSNGQWQTNEWEFYMAGPNITASLDSRTLSGTVIFGIKGKCHVTQYSGGGYGLWTHSSLSGSDGGCCESKFGEQTKGETPKKPQEKDCSTK